MKHVNLRDIPPQGLTMTVEDPAIWASPVEEFGLPLQVRTPLCARVFLLPEEEGCLIRGRIDGEVVLPCDRCAEDARVIIAHEFDDFEEYPAPEKGNEDEAFLEAEPSEGLITSENGVLVLDLAKLLWEEFSLALPVKPLCRPSCCGVCPQCGANLNDGACACSTGGGDPRLAVLRGLTVKTAG